ncbi:hypothetical protein AAFF_G00283910 [Aldrovandia affinis]|uniref:Uncharacterized protein n=1 Tax=Aldrovandia affinis TaxID=143900 RepID=A0AAD7X2M8_9TELE|nr:hypothetical protein AAFF_G00283910 [Aldrovandia affinis]
MWGRGEFTQVMKNQTMEGTFFTFRTEELPASWACLGLSYFEHHRRLFIKCLQFVPGCLESGQQGGCAALSPIPSLAAHRNVAACLPDRSTAGALYTTTPTPTAPPDLCAGQRDILHHQRWGCLARPQLPDDSGLRVPSQQWRSVSLGWFSNGTRRTSTRVYASQRALTTPPDPPTSGYTPLALCSSLKPPRP